MKNIYRKNNESNWARKVCKVILFIGDQLIGEWGDIAIGYLWERLRDSPELRV